MLSLTIVTPWKDHIDLWPAYKQAISYRRSCDEVTIVDNGSQPPLAFASDRFETNEGFQRANNYGLEKATTDAVLFLNNDVEAASAYWLDTIRAKLEPGVLVGAHLVTSVHADVDGGCKRPGRHGHLHRHRHRPLRLSHRHRGRHHPQ